MGWDDGGQGQDDAMDMNDVDAEEVERRAQLVEDELYKLNYEDVVGGIKTRFKYVDRIVQYSPLAVGYGTYSDGADYYKVKNSWGVTWGDEGFILLGRGDQYNKGQGQCGMLLSASYPNL